MLPTLEIIYNHDYAKRLYRGDEDFKDVWSRIIGLGADFEKIYEEYIQHILEAIEKYSGYPWEEYAEDTFPIYLIDQGDSLVHPLSLAVHEDPAMMLRDFVGLLARRNMYFGFPSEELKQRCVQSVVDHVLHDTTNPETGTDAIDLQTCTIKEYLQKNK